MGAPDAAGCWHTGLSTTLSGGILGRPFTQHTVEAPVDPARVWALWSEPTAWPSFWPGLAAVQIATEFQVGAEISWQPSAGGSPQQFVLVALESGRSFTLLQRLPLATLKLQHRVEACDLGCRMHLKVTLEGPLAWWQQWTKGPAWKATVPPLLRALAKAAQKP